MLVFVNFTCFTHTVYHDPQVGQTFILTRWSDIIGEVVVDVVVVLETEFTQAAFCMWNENSRCASLEWMSLEENELDIQLVNFDLEWWNDWNFGDDLDPYFLSLSRVIDGEAAQSRIIGNFSDILFEIRDRQAISTCPLAAQFRIESSWW